MGMAFFVGHINQNYIQKTYYFIIDYGSFLMKSRFTYTISRIT